MTRPLALLLLATTALAGEPPRAANAPWPGPSLGGAVPDSATEVLFVQPMRGNLEVAIDALDALFGPVSSEAFLEQAPLPALAFQVLSGITDGAHGIDPEGGLGLFQVDRYDGSVGLIAVKDAARAAAAVRAHLLAVGAKAAPAVAGAEALVLPDGRLTVFVASHGYLYLVMPQGEGSALSSALKERSTEEVVTQLRAERFRPVSDTAAWKRVVQTPADLSAINFFSSTAEGGLFDAAGALIHLHAEGAKLVIGGLLATEAPVRVPTATAGSARAHLGSVPANPVLVASLWLEPELVTRALLGAPNSWRRRLVGSKVEALGVDSTALFSSLGGRATALAYFDSELYWLGFQDNGLPLPYATLLLETAVKNPGPVDAYIRARLAAAQLEFKKAKLGKGTRYSAKVDGAALEVRLMEQSAQLSLGDTGKKRKLQNLAQTLRARFGEGPFGPGHASVLVDLHALRAELDRPIDLEGLSDEDAEAMQRFAGLLLWQVGPIDHVLLDLAASPEGLRVRGEIVFEPLSQDASVLGHR